MHENDSSAKTMDYNYYSFDVSSSVSDTKCKLLNISEGINNRKLFLVGYEVQKSLPYVNFWNGR